MSNAQIILKYRNIGTMKRIIEHLRIVSPKSRELRCLERYVNTFFNCTGIINMCTSCDLAMPIIFTNGRGDIFLSEELSPANRADWYDIIQLLYAMTENSSLRERFMKLLRDNNHEYQWVAGF